MAWTNWGFDGTINESQWAQMAGLLGNSYVAKTSSDCVVTAVGGARSVSVAAGTLYGDGIVSINSGAETVAMTTPVNGQWFVIALRRTWATNTAALVAIAGTTTTTTTPTTVPTSFPTLNTNVGVLTDQPIAWAWCNSANLTVVVSDLRDLPMKQDETIPSGMLMPFAGSTAPTGWLIANGAAISRIAYPDLYSVIGTTYGAGNGSSTFNIPDLRGRVAVGVDGGAGRITSNNALGNASGAQTHTLTTTEMPSHNHTGTVDSAGSHSHGINYAWSDANTTHNHGSSAGLVAQGQSIARGGTGTDNAVAVSNGAHQHTFTSNSTGSGGAHNNLQPYQVTNFVIKY